MGKKKVIVIGCGGRGMGYSTIMKESHSDYFEIVGIAEPVKSRREYTKNLFNTPDEMCFESWEPLLEKAKFADVCLIATQDRDHYAPAMKAIEKGYNLLLEKPVAVTPEECRDIQKAAEEKGVFVLVCHVLRFTRFFRTIKYVIDSGKIGKVKSIQHAECVGDLHYSHSYVRGNWQNSDDSSCMILAKSCHDADILAWLVGEKCTAVQSFGSLSYFKPENAPEGSPERCMDGGCPIADTCRYNAVKVYAESEGNWWHNWFTTAATKEVNPTKEQIWNTLKTTDYGKCVFKCNNNVVDHQVVNMRFGDDIYADFNMTAFNSGGRFIRIMGTKGEIEARMDSTKVVVFNFETGQYIDYGKVENVDQTVVGGHGGGDDGIITSLRNYLDGNPDNSICSIKESCDNHMICFAAEESRLNNGKTIYMDKYYK